VAISPDFGIAAYITVFRGLSLSSAQLAGAILIHVIHNCSRTINIVVAGIGDELHARRCPAHPAGARDYHVCRGSGSRPPLSLKFRHVNYSASRPSEMDGRDAIFVLRASRFGACRHPSFIESTNRKIIPLPYLSENIQEIWRRYVSRAEVDSLLADRAPKSQPANDLKSD
jgi:hypothetical protein